MPKVDLGKIGPVLPKMDRSRLPKVDRSKRLDSCGRHKNVRGAGNSRESI